VRTRAYISLLTLCRHRKFLLEWASMDEMKSLSTKLDSLVRKKTIQRQNDVLVE
jgi:hypothetical protein